MAIVSVINYPRGKDTYRQHLAETGANGKAERTLCGRPVDFKVERPHMFGGWEQERAFTCYEGEGVGCKRCLRSEAAPCEVPLHGEPTPNHKMAFTRNGVAMLCVKCGAEGNRG